MFTDGTTLYANASTCNIHYQSKNAPICYDIKLPDGFSKADLSVDREPAKDVIEKQYLEDKSQYEATQAAMSKVLAGIKLTPKD